MSMTKKSKNLLLCGLMLAGGLSGTMVAANSNWRLRPAYAQANSAVPRDWSGDCFLRCIALCESCKARNKPPAVIGHFCSQDGDGWKACVGRTENPPRCKDPNFVKQCE